MVIGEKVVAVGIFGLIFVLTLGLILGGSGLTNAMENTSRSGDAAQELRKAVAEAGARLHWRTTTSGGSGYEILSFPEGTSIKEVAGAKIGAVTLSPDATQIALFDNYYPLSEKMQGARDLVIEDIEVGTRQLTGLKARDSSLLAWSPDGKKLAMLAQEATANPNAEWPKKTTLEDLMEGSIGPLSLFIFSIPEKTVTAYDIQASQHSIFSDQIWSPSGDEIVYVKRFGSEPPFREEIHILSLVTKKIRFLAHGTYPAWSPTGNKVALCGLDDNYYLINTDGTGQELLLRVNKDFPDVVGPFLWSPDGRWLLVARWSSTPEMVDLFVIDPQTKVQTRVETKTQPSLPISMRHWPSGI